MFTLAEARIAMLAELQDDASFLSPDEIDTHLYRAARQVNLDRPLRIVDDIAGDGTQDLVLPPEFVKSFSYIESVELITDPASKTPLYLVADDDWFQYEDPSQISTEQLRLRFRLTTPQVGETVRIIFRGMYTLLEDSSNFGPAAFEALIAGGLKLAYTALAAKYSQSQDPTIAADAVDYGGRVQSFLFLRDRAEKEYNRRTGLGEPQKAAQYMTEVDIIWAHGEDFTWHPRLLR